MARVRLILVHSPLVGPATWTGVAAELRSSGHEVAAPDLTGTLADGPPYAARQLEIIAAAAGDGGRVVLVGHSGAGALLAAAGQLAGGAASYIFADAGLPIPGLTSMSTMPPELTDFLRSTADADGWLPPWSQWWGDDELTLLVPDDEIRHRFAVGCPRLPLAMFSEVMPPGEVAAPGQAAYLLLSEVYAESAARARDLGWPVVERDSHHLAPVTDPLMVAAAIVELLESLDLAG